jgi:hypothetical protein
MTDAASRSFFALPGNGSLDDDYAQWNFRPIPGLFQDGEADIQLFFLSPNMVMFREPTEDPWYNSSHTLLMSPPNNNNFTGYMAVEPASPLACRQQGQWCFGPAGSQSACTPLTGDQDQRLLMKALNNPDDYQRARWIHNVMTGNSLTNIISALATQALTSRLTYVSGLQGALAANQWQQDVAYWFDILLAGWQQGLVTAVLGDVPDQSGSDPVTIKRPDTDLASALCANQVSKSPYHGWLACRPPRRHRNCTDMSACTKRRRSSVPHTYRSACLGSPSSSCSACWSPSRRSCSTRWRAARSAASAATRTAASSGRRRASSSCSA